jgi:Concanavalin A-like lectin/glucanases superfamily
MSNSGINFESFISGSVVVTEKLSRMPTHASITSNTTLGAGEISPVNATSAPITVLLPTGKPFGTLIAVEKSDETENIVTVSGSIRGEVATDNLKLKRETVIYQAESSGSWRPLADHKTLGSLDARYPVKNTEGRIAESAVPLTVVSSSHHPGLSMYYPADYGATGDGVTDDTTALEGCFTDARAVGGTVVLGVAGSTCHYLYSRSLNYGGLKLRMAGSRGQTSLRASPSWDFTHGYHMLRNWVQTDYKAGEENYKEAPLECVTRYYYAYLDGVWLDLNGVAELRGFGGVHLNETTAVRDLAFEKPNESIGVDLKSNNDAFGACVNGSYFENTQFYGEKWKTLVSAVGQPRPASLVTGTGNSRLEYRAKNRYLADGTISITYKAGSGALSVTVVGNAITVTLASGGSTAAEVKTALLASEAASKLVSVGLITEPASGAVTGIAATFLVNGGLEKALTFDFGIDLRMNGMTSAAVCSGSVFYLQNVSHVHFNDNHCESVVNPALSAETDLAIVRLHNVKDFQETDGYQTLSKHLKHSRWYATNTLTPPTEGVTGGAQTGGPTQFNGPMIENFTQSNAFGSYEGVAMLNDTARGFTSSADISAIYRYDGTTFRYRTNDGVEHVEGAVPLASLPSLQYQDPTLTSAFSYSPALLLPFLENTNDVSGHANKGTAVGSPVYGAGRLGAMKALELSGSSQYVTTPFKVKSGTNYTFFGWANRADTAASHSLFQATSVSHSVLALLLSGSENVQFFPDSGGGAVEWAAAWPGTAQWVAWAITYNSATKACVLWINGVSKGSQTASTTIKEELALAVGFRVSECWHGAMSGFGVCEAVLTQEHIEALAGISATSLHAPALVMATEKVGIPAGVTHAKITAVGGGGGGGGGGSAAVAQLNAGGSGGTAGVCSTQLVSLGANTELTVTIGAGGEGGAGGALGGHEGIAGANGGETTVTGTGISVTGNRGGKGKGSAASSTSGVIAVGYGATGTESTSGNLASEGGSSGSGGGKPMLQSGGGGGGGGAASATLGGGGGGAGTAVNGGAAGTSGTSGTSAGVEGASAAANTSAGGGGGGGGAAGTGAGGKGGNGGSGFAVIEWLP